ncbi:hypothetical protein Cfor_03714 [Coptotermes formosanus]|uniref:Reverse transcriptase domain-containing protein n=1 Tax=Coptotermes formosanus TaxID=36987 RepID=A0A6L2PW02_COPFO|nr:hypothetical protein Cfor_03714 [Coptotermes formosanus]
MTNSSRNQDHSRVHDINTTIFKIPTVISVQILAYADDIDIISRSPKSLQEATGALDRAARMMGLEINQAKTKYMICGAKKKYTENVFKVKHVTFERVNSFMYLGTLITADNNISAEINDRITLANRSYFGMRSLMTAIIGQN